MFDHVKFRSERLCGEQGVLPEGTRVICPDGHIIEAVATNPRPDPPTLHQPRRHPP